jgi:hypothetical protein
MQLKAHTWHTHITQLAYTLCTMSIAKHLLDTMSAQTPLVPHQYAYQDAMHVQLLQEAVHALVGSGKGGSEFIRASSERQLTLLPGCTLTLLGALWV